MNEQHCFEDCPACGGTGTGGTGNKRQVAESSGDYKGCLWSKYWDEMQALRERLEEEKEARRDFVPHAQARADVQKAVAAERELLLPKIESLREENESLRKRLKKLSEVNYWANQKNIRIEKDFTKYVKQSVDIASYTRQLESHLKESSDEF